VVFSQKPVALERQTLTSHFLRLALAVSLAGIASGRTIGPDAFGYFATDGTISYTSIIGAGGTLIPDSNADDAIFLTTLPFPIVFYGTTYGAGSQISLSTNGNVQFRSFAANPTLTNRALNDPLVNFTAPTIFGYWDDLVYTTAPGAGIYTQTQVVGPTRTFVVEWLGRRFADGASTPTIQFQVVFQEGSTDISVRYAQTGIGNALNGVGATTGIRLDQSTNLQWSHDEGVLSPGLEVRYTLDNPSNDAVPEPASVVSVVGGLALVALTRLRKA
jgi:hypothetical protein